ncbi:MAG: amino acid adenylation domain-containing protein, partial [Vampirovibrionia bacterium]
FFIQLDKMPLTHNGKVDREALPEPFKSKSNYKKIIKPTNYEEEVLYSIWQNILSHNKFCINDSFFTVGGNSLKAIKMQFLIEEKFNIDMPIKQIFECKNICEIAKLIKHSTTKINNEITAINVSEYYQLSPIQQRLYFIEQMSDIGTTYNNPIGIELPVNTDIEKLSNSIDKVVNRHELLRTYFEVVEGKTVQKIENKIILKKIIRNINENELQSVVKRFVKPFELNKAPLFRTELLNIEDKKYILLFDFHHIIIDGVSIVNIINDIASLYNNIQLNEIKITYKDYAQWLNNFTKSEKINTQEEFWLKQFEGEIPILELPTDKPYPAQIDFIGDEITSNISADLAIKIQKYCTTQNITPYIFFLSAYFILLHKYTQQEDIVIGSPIAGRNNNNLKDIVGMFVNTLPIRNYPVSNKNIIEFIKDVQANFLSALENQDYQLDTLIEKLNIKRNSSKHPLFDTVMVYQNMGLNEVKTDTISLKPITFKKTNAKFDLMLEILENNNDFTFNWNFRTNLFNNDTIERINKHFINLLNDIVNNKPELINDISILSKEEELELLFDFNDTMIDYPHNICIHEIFENQVKKYPQNIAVKYLDTSITYEKLNEKANQLARFLRKNNVKNDTIVAVLLDRSINMIISLLAILKAGGCYLPINPDYPSDRTNYILENSESIILLTTSNYMNTVELNGLKVNLDIPEVYNEENSNLNNINDPEDLAYIIYTSGSTGKPKGVMIQHKNVIRLLINDKQLFDFNENDTWTMFHSFCFDFSVWEVYGSILFGGKLIIVPKDAALNPQLFLELLIKEQVTVLNQTPGAFYNLIEEDLKGTDNDLKIRFVIFGGEALKPIMLKQWHFKYPKTKLVNMYGITETTVHVTYKEITDYEINNNISNIGKPIPTLSTYIMDKNLKLNPIGVIGEICVGGEGVARGYVNRPELTKERFVTNPYPPHDRIYRSGDLAKLLPNGEMVYYGRMDFQVKIRGFRIELAEIENKLLKNPDIKNGIVLAQDLKDGNKVLVAYLVMNNDMSIPDLRSFLSEDLPDYMIPSYFIKMDELPLTSNKKVDRRALPDPITCIDTGVTYIPPENEIQEKITQIWQQILGVEKISINDNFFALGGHSLKAVTLVAELQKYFNVTVNSIFEHQTIKELSENIKPVENNIKNQLLTIRDNYKDTNSDKVLPEEIIDKINQYNTSYENYN